MKSTSVHALNSDKKMMPGGRAAWMIANWFNNRFLPNLGSGQLHIRDFVPDVSDEQWGRTIKGSSPSRKLSDLFWMQLPWEEISAEIGGLRIFDTGCGTGGFGERLLSISRGTISKYTGVDASPRSNWPDLERKHPDFRLRHLDSNDISASIPDDTNFFMSQSAIEHFEEDLVYFGQIRDFLNRTKRNTLQVHLFPSSACLNLYLHHGIRQYVPRTVSRIAKIFNDFSQSTLFRLGGANCNRLHWSFITKPKFAGNLFGTKRRDLRLEKPEEYDMRLREAIQEDAREPGSDPSFYALVIHSHSRSQIFSERGMSRAIAKISEMA